MKKTSKFATVAVALTLGLSTMLTGCNPTTPQGPVISAELQAVLTKVSEDWNAASALEIKQDAFDRLLEYYNNPGSVGGETGELTYAADTTLRMATGYNNAKTGITFDSATAGSGITLADGKTYNTGDLKPTWVEVQNRLNVKFVDKWTGAGSAEKEFGVWSEKMNEVDMVAGSASKLQEAGMEGKLINLANYLNKMPNFKSYLEANPIVRLSITGSTTGETKGAIFFSPYFDGVDDIERMPLMRTDFVEKLLNGAGEFTATASADLKAAKYTPYMPTSGKVAVDVADTASAKKSITKDYDKAGNIVEKMNKALAEGTVTGVQAVNMLRKYIDEAYNGYYGENRANLFIGQNAAWDADELVALLRCVTANAKTLNGTDTIQGLFSREDGNNQRRIDLFRFAGTLFGVRGLEARQDYLYFGTDGKLHDARQEADTYLALEKMNQMAIEGLVSADYINKGTSTSTNYLENDNGFMSYDYCQTQTLMNKTKLQNADGESYAPVLVPVAKWEDGDSATPDFFRFTESWRSVKTDGWALSKDGIGADTNKLNAALKLIDYAYSPAGQILMSYGPDAFIQVKAGQESKEVETWEDVATKYETFNFNGKEMPKIAAATNTELWNTAGGNYTNYARFYLGSTLSFVKSQAFEIQCTHEVGKAGSERMSNAIALGIIKHPLLTVNTSNMWYTSIPTILPTTAAQNTELNGYAELTSNGKFSQSKDKVNLLTDFIANGYEAFAD